MNNPKAIVPFFYRCKCISPKLVKNQKEFKSATMIPFALVANFSVLQTRIYMSKNSARLDQRVKALREA